MRPTQAYESNDGRLFKVAAEAQRHDDAQLAKPLLVALNGCLARARDASLGEEYGLLEFLRKNAATIRSFTS